MTPKSLRNTALLYSVLLFLENGGVRPFEKDHSQASVGLALLWRDQVDQAQSGV